MSAIPSTTTDAMPIHRDKEDLPGAPLLGVKTKKKEKIIANMQRRTAKFVGSRTAR
jgi:hypothetical protein